MAMRKKAPGAAMPDDGLERLHGANGEGVAGIDEAGRGPLAGPVVAAAVLFPSGTHPIGLDDSKALSAAARERLFEEILATGSVGIASVGPEGIDRLNIRGATLLAMRRAVLALAQRPAHALVDGRDVPPDLPCPATAVIGGDARSVSIAAASIVAKVVRDRMMAQLALAHPGYGFERHMGYGTAAHLDALRRLGPTIHHRRSFAPVRALLAL